LLFERRNGNFTLQITGHPEFGLPFGQDRLVLIFLATLAVRQKSQVVRFRSAAEMLDTFEMAKGGKEYRRIVSAFERVFGATIFFSTVMARANATLLHRGRFNFLREAEIWCDRSGGLPSHENVVILSDEFYAEVSAHPVPADLVAIKVLAAAPALLDLFMWLTYRCFVAKGPEAIPLFGPLALPSNLVVSSTLARAAFAACWNSGFGRFASYGPLVQQMSIAMARCCSLIAGARFTPRLGRAND
jgi:hypothetical protein